ncbi:MAG TPA: signal recognition particle-docking protein FtsY [Candidatus Acidoferrum sp.]|nr:signal recognition particle-docking protein FtsY [Candidatus Acidoferrum sp.]
MFDELRKKISNAVKGLVKKEEKKIEEGQQPQEQEAEAHKPAVHKPPQEKQEAKLEVSTSIATKVKGVFLGSVKLSESEIDGFLEDLEKSLLQSDVSYDAASDFISILREKMLETRFKTKEINEEALNAVRASLFELLNRSKPGVDIIKFIKERASAKETPVKILFLGPNGTGKTTTMGKIASMLKNNGITSVFSASDTFRAAAIEQTEHHAKAIGIPVIKSSYGADPASVAFDAIAYAKAHEIQAVLIDTAGRQETNRNLINEMLKMVKVAKPDITIFIGESTAGNALSNQITEFSKHMKIDGIVLTKLDCDAKGGNAVSIAHSTGIPVLFFGIGEKYDAIVKYTPEFVVNSILPNN